MGLNYVLILIQKIFKLVTPNMELEDINEYDKQGIEEGIMETIKESMKKRKIIKRDHDFIKINKRMSRIELKRHQKIIKEVKNGKKRKSKKKC